MFCYRCGTRIEEHWEFCPKCGSPLMKPLKYGKDEKRQMSFGNLFDALTKEMEMIKKQSDREFKEIDKNFEVFDLTPKFKPGESKGKGFSIFIKTGTGEKPVVKVKTFGDVDREKLNKEIEHKFGIPLEKQGLEKGIRVPEKTEEPKTEIKKLPNRVLIELRLPGIKALGDISIKIHRESVEIRALTKDVLYFKILQLPPQWKLSSKELKNETLKLEFAP